MTVEVNDVFVPRLRALNVMDLRGGGTAPGTRTNPSALYRVAMSGFSGHIIASTLVGNASAALELTVDTIKQKSSGYTGAKLRDVQAVKRSEERRVGKECVSPCRSRCSPDT